MAQIKKDTSLRKAILQAAITGQLINDVEGTTETGKELLDRIKKQKCENKNVKNEKPLTPITEDEIPFEIPENWCWCKFGEIMINRDSERIPLSVSQRELLDKKYDYYGASGVIDKVDNYLFDKDLLLIGEDGANLLTRSTPIAFIASGKYWVNNHAHVLDCDSNSINMKYIMYFINAISLAKYVTGTAQPKMNQEKMNSIPVALPPLSVQNAIVKKLEQVLPLVDAYENAVLQKEELKNALPDKVKKAILQEVITGKLTETWRRTANITENGKQLLDRIIAERNEKAHAEWEEALKKNPKAKKPVAVVASEIEEEDIPFEVPESWCWCRWGELSDSIQYGYNAPAKETGRIKMVRITDIQNGKVKWETVPYCDISDDEIITYKLKKNDILFARTGGTVGKSFLVDEEPEDAVYAGYLIRTQYNDEMLNPKYMKMFMESQLYWEQLKNGTIATAQPNCNGQTLSKMILPLPPLKEQE